MKPFTCFLTALMASPFLAGCGTFSSTHHDNGAVEQNKTQATKKQTSTAAAVGGAALCGAIANKTTSKKHRTKATILAAAVCGGAAYAATRAGYEKDMLDRLEKHLTTITKPGVEISRGNNGKIVSIVFNGEYENIPGDTSVIQNAESEISFIAKTMSLFPEVYALIATADPNDKNFKGIGYKRAQKWSSTLISKGAPGKRIQYTSLANSPRGAITQIDFTVRS